MKIQVQAMTSEEIRKQRERAAKERRGKPSRDLQEKLGLFREKNRNHKFSSYCPCQQCGDRVKEIRASRLAAESY